MKYPKTIIDEASGIELPNPKYEAYKEAVKDILDIIMPIPVIEFILEDNPRFQAFLKENELEG